MRGLIFPFLLLAAQAAAEGFEDFLTQINLAPMADRPALVDSLLADLPGDRAPIVEQGRAWFLYHGSASALQLAGDMTGWEPNLSFVQIGGTELWYKRFLCEDDARLDYKIVRNGSDWLLDPLNPATCAGGFGPNSELAMSAYVQPVEIGNHGYPEGELLVWTSVYSPQLNNSRTIRILLPPDYQSGQNRELCLVHDGQDYLQLAMLARVTAWVAHEAPDQELPVFVCVPPVNRTAEYAGAQQEPFGEFLIETVLPMVVDSLGLPAIPDDMISMGASNGGNISAWLAVSYPQYFNRLILMSPYLPNEQLAGLAGLEQASLEIYMNWGSYDIASLLPLIEEAEGLFEEKEFNTFARMYHEGHSWGLWRATIDEALAFLYQLDLDLGDAPGLRPDSRDLLSVWPNPFNGSLHVEQPDFARDLRVYNLQGQLVDLLLADGRASWQWQAGERAGGIYLLEARGHTESRLGKAVFLP